MTDWREIAQRMWDGDYASVDELAQAMAAEAGDEIERLRAALEIIAGRRQCLDNLMSNAEVARAALGERPKRREGI